MSNHSIGTTLGPDVVEALLGAPGVRGKLRAKLDALLQEQDPDVVHDEYVARKAAADRHWEEVVTSLPCLPGTHRSPKTGEDLSKDCTNFRRHVRFCLTWTSFWDHDVDACGVSYNVASRASVAFAVELLRSELQAAMAVHEASVRRYAASPRRNAVMTERLRLFEKSLAVLYMRGAVTDMFDVAVRQAGSSGGVYGVGVLYVVHKLIHVPELRQRVWTALME
jgi:hypothetical protein